MGVTTMLDLKIKRAGATGLTATDIAKARNYFFAISLIYQKECWDKHAKEMLALAEGIEFLIAVHQKINEDMGYLWRNCY